MLRVFFAVVSLSVSAMAQIRDIKLTDAQKISADATTARQQLSNMGVVYLWKMNGSDITVQNQMPVVSDFMGNSIAQAENNLVSVQDCYDPKDSSKLVDSYVLFERPSPDFPVGGYLKVSELKQEFSKLEADSEFTVGGWFKQYPDFVEDFKNIEPGKLAHGYMPALTRFEKSSPGHIGGMEWIMQMTNEITYVNINRGWTGQNDMNTGLPWWAHTYGTCYTGNYHDECWHYVSVAVNPAKNTVQFVISRQPDHTAGEDFLATGITNAALNATPITHMKNAVLQIGAGEGSGTHGLIRGLYFARKALSSTESKAISLYTAPAFKPLKCTSGRYLKKRAY